MRGGFALLVALVLMAFIFLLLTSLTALVRVETMSTQTSSSEVVARQNAKFGLLVAMGKLQQLAGPDRRVTARAEITAAATPNPMWTGVWKSTPPLEYNALAPIPPRMNGMETYTDSNLYLMNWLVSGNEGTQTVDGADAIPIISPQRNLESNADFGHSATAEAVYLVGAGTLIGSGEETVAGATGNVVAPKVRVKGTNNATEGHYAWWVGDEGVKARVQYRETPVPLGNTVSLGTQLAFQLPSASNPELIGGLEFLDRDESTLARCINRKALEIYAANDAQKQGIRGRWHDLTLSSYGLLTDTRWGGMRGDLSQAFESDTLFVRYFNETDNTLYFIDIDQYSYVSGFPNWDILRDYYLLKDKVSNGGINMTMPNPKDANGDTSLSPKAFPWKDTYASDQYQRNNPVLPVVARMQVCIGLRFDQHTITNSITGATENVYSPTILLKPIVALYNPYNVTLNPGLDASGSLVTNIFQWESSPTLNITVGGNTTVSFSLQEIFSSKERQSIGYKAAKYLSFKLPNTDLQPGETRYFTFANDSLRSTFEATLESSASLWDESQGYLQLPLYDTSKDETTCWVATVDGLSEDVSSGDFGLTANEITQLQAQDSSDIVTITFDKINGGALRLSTNNFLNDVQAKNKYAIRFVSLASSSLPTGVAPAPQSFTVASKVPVGSYSNGANPILASWGFGLRTANEAGTQTRTLIDSNLRAVTGHMGLEDPSGSFNFMGLYSGEIEGSETYGFVTTDPLPQISDMGRLSGFWGNSTTANGGTERVVLFDIPREPILSLGAFQHANLGRYNTDPTYIVGHSFAPFRLKSLNNPYSTNFAGKSGYDIWDLSWLINQQLWDSYYFSTIPDDLDQSQLDTLTDGTAALNNHRLSLYVDAKTITPLELTDTADDADTFYKNATHLMVNGAFNINSTSVAAWKSLLGSLKELEIPQYAKQGSNAGLYTGTQTEADTAISHLPNPVNTAYSSGDSATYWSGYRSLSDSELNDLAQAIVTEIEARGSPFANLAEFVNRPLENSANGKAGLLQRAIDAAGLNNSVASSSISGQSLPGEVTHDELNGSNQGVGFTSYLTQADILQALGPVLSARSDTFVIRSYGDATSPLTGSIQARAWCEAIVQRLPDETVNGRDMLDRDANRRFVIVSFRWLNENEI
ncbi:hypothetical protein [Ruficoccus sp. ZRK36]|uniref:hypothetical protein n=1 Tax=Ruficoccus sp. ZRK36 TaxID=2866311 RepID=UPI001C73A024|nr:hypothetical protein [Ruficoccus sp. ZRK36]QYY37235.1 hypothetical protein K0V07_07065 [Ruficoccus sp. ZRK36]